MDFLRRSFGLFLILINAIGCQSVPRAAVSPSSWLEIDRGAFGRNVRRVEALVGPRTKICAVLKGDAYGHGLSLLAPSLVSLGVPCAAITSNEEARTLREAGFDRQIIRIRTANLDEIEAALPLAVDEILGNLDQALAVARLLAKRQRSLNYHLALNAGGMSRNGIEVATESGKREALAILKLPHLSLVGIFTHFAVEERNDVARGLALFTQQVDWLVEHGALDRKRLTLHCANSFAMLEVPASRLDMVRPGETLYGGTVANHSEYEQVLTFKTRVASINRYPAGNTVSYDRTHLLRRDSRLANLPVGYANGYRRDFSNRAFVLIRGKRVPVVGRVTMNTAMVDVTDLPDVLVGDEVVLFGRQGESTISWKDLEKIAGSIPADVFAAWGVGNPKVARDTDQPVTKVAP